MGEPAPDGGLVACRRCPRLVAWRERVAEEKRAAFRDETYWGRPVPGFGDPAARLVVVGLAPAAHGANRTGRMFTGDRSGDWLFRALHRAGLADRPTSTSRDDGLTLRDCYVTAVVHCAPPGNRPTAAEEAACAYWVERELGALDRAQALIALGGVAFTRLLRIAPELGWGVPTPRPRFAHGRRVELDGGPVLVGCYHPSQQNTFTGRLSEGMLDEVVEQAKAVIGH